MDNATLEPLECVLITQAEDGTTTIKKFVSELELAHWLIETYGPDLAAQGATL